MKRLTFGATPQLYARFRALGFQGFVEEQLSPQTINDSAFEATMPEDLLTEVNNKSRLLQGVRSNSIAYSAYSQRQLNEVMAQFWSNHFHAIARDDKSIYGEIMDLDGYRDLALSSFEQLLEYSAKNVLMMDYLDNMRSRAGNLNENYAREVLELHTVGVDGGYTIDDIIAVAEIFTGWGRTQVRDYKGGLARIHEFTFFPEYHDTSDKTLTFLNATITGRSGAAGIEEGEELIALLSDAPATRAYVCGKLVEFFVADERPDYFVNVCDTAWAASDGDVKTILRAILLDPAYISTPAYPNSKIRTPFEYTVGLMRAFSADPFGADEGDFYEDYSAIFLGGGQDQLNYPVPTGTAEVGKAWANTASMIGEYRGHLNIAYNKMDAYGIALATEVQAAGLETAEEVAAYLLTLATADHFRADEFDAVVETLRGADGIFEPQLQDESIALRRALSMVGVMPSVLLQ